MTSNRFELIIYIPTYNRLEKLKNCLNAISREIIGLEDKVLVYVSNNGSVDGTGDYLKSLDYKWLHIRHNQENVGSALNILHCFDLPIKSEFVWPIGDDDYVMPNSISGILSIITKYSNADYIFCNTKAFPTEHSAEILKQYFEIGSVDGGTVKSRKYTGTSLVNFEQLIDPDIADTLLGELMVHCFKQSSIQFDVKEIMGLNADTVDWDKLDFETAGKLIHPHTLPFLSCFTRLTKAIYCDVPRTFNFWGSATWLGDYDFVFPTGILFLISQYKERGFISDDKLVKLLDYYYAIMGGSLTRQINGQSTARPFNSAVKAKMFEFLFLYMNKHGKEYDKKLTTAISREKINKRKAAAMPDKQPDRIIETTQKASKSNSNPANLSSDTPFTSIIILTFNQLEHTKPCLQSIEQHTPQPHELIIVDNGSTDGTLDYLRKYANDHNNVRVISNKENLGFAAGNNQGLAVANGDYLLLLNNDTVVTEGWLARMLSVFERYSDVGIVGPVSNNISGPQQVKEASYQSLGKMHHFAKHWSAAHTGQTMEFYRVVGFCLLAKREVIDRIGGLDEQFGSGNFEDDDFCLRAVVAGYKACIALDAFVHHTGSQTFKGAGINYQQSLERNWKIFKAKWKLPQDQPYGTYSINLSNIDLSQYNTPIPPRIEIMPLIINAPSSEDNAISNMFGKEAQQPLELSDEKSKVQSGAFSVIAAKEIPSLIHSEFIEGLTSIIILTHNRLEYTKKCVKSIRKNTPEAHEFIFVDNGSTDGTVKWLQSQVRENKSCHLIENKENVGLAKGRNQGINLSQGEFIALINNDVVVSEGWLDRMLQCLNSRPDIGIVGPMSNNVSGLQQVADDSYQIADFIDKNAEKFKEQFNHRRIPYRNIAGFCMLFKRTLTEKIGLLDERFDTGHFEDEDFCWRSALEGFQNYIDGDVFVHYAGKKESPGDRNIINKKWTLSMASPEGKKLAVLKSTEFADVLYQKGLMDQAIEALINCIKLTPDAKEIYYELTRIFIESKRFSEAWEVIGTMPDAAKNDLKGLECAGYAKEGLGLDDEAAEYADRMLSINENYPAALNLKGVLAYKKGEKEKAADYFQKGIDADPGYGEAYTNLGVFYWSMDKKDEALMHLQKGFILSPTVPDVSSLYYSVIASSGIFSDAEADYRKASKLYPNNKNLAFLSIDILIQQGKFDEALIQIQDVLVSYGLDDGILNAALDVREKIGPLQIEKASKKGTLSLCMIVKNEEKYLLQCLKSVRDIIDEIIIVDTGSTDKTVGIAKVFGAKLFDFPWTGDFAAARNHSLEQATGNWILILDGDEVLSPLDFKELKEIIHKKSSSPAAYSIATRNYITNVSAIGWEKNDGEYPEEAGTGWVVSKKVRLLTRNKAAVFSNPVHETLEASLAKAKIPVQPCKIIVHHYGKLDAQKDLQKGEDYYLLGKIKYENDPTNTKYVLELARQAQVLGKHEEAVELWLKLISLFQEAAPDSLAYQHIVQSTYGDPLAEIYTQIASAYLMLNRYEEALAAARKAIKGKTKLKEYVHVYAHCEIVAGSLTNAFCELEELLKTTPDYPPAVVLMATIFCLEGKKEKAQESFQLLLQKNVNMTPLLNTYASQLHTHEKKDEALLILNAMIENKLNDMETMRLVDVLQKG
jgi:GT2 family glycosyltransferase/Tfp pilus assembly protein PilF